MEWGGSLAHPGTIVNSTGGTFQKSEKLLLSNDRLARKEGEESPMKASRDWPAIFFVMACACAHASGEGTRLANGVWGGDSVILEVAADGASLEFDCAHGRITQTIRIDEKGKFDVAGNYQAETPGPARDDAPPPAPARYQGTIKGDSMTLLITRADQRIGTFELTRGRQTFLRKCR
jgi:hypothetical protein